MSHPSHLLSTTKSKYLKFKSRLEKRISNGTFDSLSRRKKNSLIARVEKFRARLESMGLSMKGAAVASSVAAGAILPNVADAQSQGIYFRKTGGAIPFNAGTNDFVMANFDADPELEIIMSASRGGHMLNGDITNGFTTSTPAAFSNMVEEILVGNIDGDADLDLIFTSSGDGTYIHRGVNNNGTFTATNFIGSGASGSHVDLVDWDSDGDLDVVMSSNGNYFNVLVNDGAGNFTDYGSNIYLNQTNVRDLEFADIDNDGDMDLIHVAYLNTVPYTGSINIQENTTDGPGVPTFDVLNPVKVREIDNTRFDGITTLDMDGDGDLDLFWRQAYFSAGFASQNRLIEGTPLGFLDVTVSSAPGSSGALNDAAVADFDNDGDDDLILVRSTAYNELLRFNGSTLSSLGGDLDSDMGNVTGNLTNIVLGDLDGDGNLDLVGRSSGNSYAYLDVSGVQKIVITPDDFTERRAAANAEIGALIAFDRNVNDIGDTDGGTVFSFIAGDGTNDADNGRFVISGSGSTAKLEVGATDLDFETQSTYRILINGLASGVNREFALELHLKDSPETGHGTFEANSSPVDNSRTQFPIMADIDGDGDNELIYKNGSGVSDILVQDDLTQEGGTVTANGGTFFLSDFDDDGDLDLIVGDQYDLKIYTNNGAGSFAYSFGQTLSGSIYDVGIADFDCDGDKDFLAATYAGVYLEFNDNNQGFSGRNPINYNSSHHIEVGDFDGDGQTDFIWGYNDNSYVNINDGGASFSQTGTYSYGSTVTLKVADFDGDGDLDILIPAGGDLNLLDGQGTGSFITSGTSIANIVDNNDTDEVVIGDIDADGLLDVVFISDHGPEGDLIAVVHNEGGGSFDLVQDLPISTSDVYASFRGLALGDVDGDDDLDIVISSNNEREVLENTNIAPYISGFSGRTIIDENTPVGTELGQLLVDDPNGDGINSVAFAAGDNNNDLFIIDPSNNVVLNSELDWETLGSDLKVEIEVQDNLGNSRVEQGQLKLNNIAEEGHGIFNDEPLRIFGSHQARTIQPGDYDMDGDGDLFSSSDFSPYNSIFQQNSASFANEPVNTINSFKYTANEMAFLDHDNDGDLDVLTHSNGGLRIAKNEEGNFTENDVIGSYNDVDQIITGDFDGDGLLEVAVTRSEEYHSGSFDYYYNGVQIIEVDEDGNFNTGQYLQTYHSGTGGLIGRYIENKAIADFDGDGYNDLLVFTESGDDVIFPGTSSNFSTSHTPAITQNDYGFSYGLSGDVTGDGVPDIISVRGDATGLQKIIDIYANDGTGSFSLNQSIGGTQLTAIAVGDVDGDGSLDIITASYEDDGSSQTNYDIDIRTNDGSGTFSLVQTIADVDADKLKLMDVDGDDDLDIVMRRTYREAEDDNVLFAFRNSNVAPTAINLSSTTFDEHLPEDTEVATITIDDLNLNDEHVISLVTGDGSNDAHNSFFYLNDNSLRLTKDVTFEDTPQLFILLSVYDGHQTYEQEVIFDVNDVNVAPTAINLSSTSFDERTTPGSVIATLSADDINVGDDHFFEFGTGDGTNDADNGDFIIDGNSLIIAVESQHEVKSTYNIYLAASDIDNTIEQAFVLTVNNVNEVPTAITLSATDFDEGTAPGSAIATMDAVDANAGDSHSFELTPGDGTNDADNGSFVVDGDQLIITESSNFETKSSYNVYLSAADSEGSFEQAFVLTVNDINQAPTAIALSNTALDEGSVGTAVAEISVTDPNAGDAHELSLATGDGTNDANNDLFAISGSDLILIGDVEFNNTPALNILISANDGSESLEQAFVLTVNEVLGLEDEISNTLGIYPNPGNDRLEINMENTLIGNMSIKISDLSGKIIHSYASEKITDRWVDQVDMTSAMPGIYLVRITIDDQQFVQRWIKSK